MNDDGFGAFFAGIFFGLIIGAMFVGFLKPSYEDGQIDALTGNIRYELVVNADSTRTWEEINK